jgi:uncharacterized membrane protein
MFWLAGVLLGCSSVVPAGEGEPFAADPPGAYVYRCDGERLLLVRVLGDSIRVQEDLYIVTLPRVVSASGARYGAHGVTFWSRGTEAMFELPHGRLERCRGYRAGTPWEASRLLGYDFRAVGQEPGWVVEIDVDRRMHVLADYGEVEFFTARPTVAALAGGTTEYRAGSSAGEVVVTVHERPCEDVMSGEAFPRTVMLGYDGREFSGCGRTRDDPPPAAPEGV